MNSLATPQEAVAAISTAPMLKIDNLNAWYAESKVLHGIGLRSVRHMVQRAGGWVDTGGSSRLGGASVRIHLPALVSGPTS